MTLLGKILLFVNLFLSLLMAGWGAALYTGRINWTDRPSPEAEQGELKKVVERTKPLQDVVKTADARYHDAAAQLATAQRKRDYNVKWYKLAADHLQTKANDQQPAVEPVLEGGLAKPQEPTRDNPAPLVVVAAKDRVGEPVRSYTSYVNDLAGVQTQIKAEQDRLAEENKKYADLSQQIVGVLEGMGAQAKVIKAGLRQLLQDEEDKLNKVLAQQEELRPLLVNIYSEIQLLAKRRDQLKKQVKDRGGDDRDEAAGKVVIRLDK